MSDQRKQALEASFREVFGSPGNRSQKQLIVMAWLEHYCFKRRSTATAPDQQHAEGRRDVLLEIERRVELPPPTIGDILGIPPTSGETDD